MDSLGIARQPRAGIPSQDFAHEAETARSRYARLKWLTTVVPALVVFAYETARSQVPAHLFPTAYSNLLVGLLTLGLAYIFSHFVFGIVERLEAQALGHSREAAALRAMVEERERLSRELHDGLAQLVAYLLVRLDTVIQLVGAGRQAEASVELERLRAVADDLSADVRESILGLRSRVVEHGLLPAIRDYAGAFEERHHIVVDVEGDHLTQSLPPLASFQLFRIAQEALTNVRKHARAQRAWVSLRQVEPGVVELRISDDGVGLRGTAVDRVRQGRFGLTTMRERAASLGGVLWLEARPGGGTSVVVRVPWESGRGAA